MVQMFSCMMLYGTWAVYPALLKLSLGPPCEDTEMFEKERNRCRIVAKRGRVSKSEWSETFTLCPALSLCGCNGNCMGRLSLALI